MTSLPNPFDGEEPRLPPGPHRYWVDEWEGDIRWRTGDLAGTVAPIRARLSWSSALEGRGVMSLPFSPVPIQLIFGGSVDFSALRMRIVMDADDFRDHPIVCEGWIDAFGSGMSGSAVMPVQKSGRPHEDDVHGQFQLRRHRVEVDEHGHVI
jgi:hypothetical protein